VPARGGHAFAGRDDIARGNEQLVAAVRRLVCRGVLDNALATWRREFARATVHALRQVERRHVPQGDAGHLAVAFLDPFDAAERGEPQAVGAFQRVEPGRPRGEIERVRDSRRRASGFDVIELRHQFVDGASDARDIGAVPEPVEQPCHRERVAPRKGASHGVEPCRKGAKRRCRYVRIDLHPGHAGVGGSGSRANAGVRGHKRLLGVGHRNGATVAPPDEHVAFSGRHSRRPCAAPDVVERARLHVHERHTRPWLRCRRRLPPPPRSVTRGRRWHLAVGAGACEDQEQCE